MRPSLLVSAALALPALLALPAPSPAALPQDGAWDLEGGTRVRVAARGRTVVQKAPDTVALATDGGGGWSFTFGSEPGTEYAGTILQAGRITLLEPDGATRDAWIAALAAGLEQQGIEVGDLEDHSWRILARERTRRGEPRLGLSLRIGVRLRVIVEGRALWLRVSARGRYAGPRAP